MIKTVASRFQIFKAKMHQIIFFRLGLHQRKGERGEVPSTFYRGSAPMDLTDVHTVRVACNLLKAVTLFTL